jgi:HEAT repeat protein
MSIERGRWRGELSRRILERLEYSKFTHAQLAAAAGVRVAAVGDALNPVKDPPSAGLLDLLAGILGITGTGLIQLHVLRDRADAASRQASPRLHAYLDAARQAARERPYLGAALGSGPPLPEIYISQSAYFYSDDWNEPLLHTGRPLDAEAVLRQGRDCCIFGGPGAGKSTLLRVCLAAMADRWLQGQADSAIPVLVPAAALGKENVPLPQALAATVSADLSDAGLPDLISADFFQLESLPGIPWLLLVDGLDDISDWKVRNTVLNNVSANAGGAASPYRFVIAVRSPSSLGIGRHWPSYWLRQFAPADVQEIARRWFAALGSTAPEDMARSFADAIERAHLTEMSRTPMIATMLCQLYAAAPYAPLASGRSAIYQRFIELLHGRQNQRGIRTETRAALRQHGENAVTRAQHAFEHRRPLLASLAVQRRAGNTEKTLDVLLKQPDATCPEQVPQQLWQEFLTEIIEHSGLMANQHSDLTFLHQTFADYLAAGHVAANPQDTAKESSKLFGGGSKSGLWPDVTWMDRPYKDDSFTGFLLDAWLNTPVDPGKPLRHIAAGSPYGCQFIIAQARLGTRLPVNIIAAAADGLARCAADPTKDVMSRREAAGTLTDLGDARSRSLLTHMANEFNSRYELFALRALADLGDSRAFEALAVIAETRSRESERLAAVISLAELGDPHGQDLMAAMAADPAVSATGRSRVAKELAELGDPRGREVLAVMAADTDLSSAQRRRAARYLIIAGDPRGRAALAAMAADSRVNGSRRRQAATTLAEFGDSRGTALLASMAVDPRLDPPWCRRAAETLAALGDYRGADALVAIATDTALDHPWRRRAAEALSELGDPRGPSALNSLEDEP